MIRFIFTIDYEIYGSGEGALADLVTEPTERLAEVFRRFGATFVVFAEAVEFERIDAFQSDPGITAVRDQLRRLWREGFEIGLHLHPWWANARHVDGTWVLDYADRNICRMPEERMQEIVGGAIRYLRDVLQEPVWEPVSFRGGLWLMQPTATFGRVLARNGIRVDSSVFKGGVVRDLGIDYRPSLRNPDAWRFSDDVNVPDRQGLLLELPIHSEMVPFWQMLGGKRLKIQRKVQTGRNGSPLGKRYRDFLRLRYPKKLDFCRMDFDEMRFVMERVVTADRKDPGTRRTVVSIGHSKDLVDLDTVHRFLEYLRSRSIEVIDFRRALRDLGDREASVPNMSPFVGGGTSTSRV